MLKSALTVGVGTTVSRVLGLVRDVLIAQAFGATSGADAFLVAFRIPNFLRRLFAEGAFSQAFVPVLSEYRATQGEAATKELIGATTGALACVLLVVTAVCVVFASGLVWVFAPGFAADAEKSALTTSMLRVTFPYLFLISLTALAGGVLNTFGSQFPQLHRSSLISRSSARRCFLRLT
jgi:putative peptidoglycan lipid II flippase